MGSTMGSVMAFSVERTIGDDGIGLGNIFLWVDPWAKCPRWHHRAPWNKKS